ncbi:unnamed protein product, partial [Rangifer tarandus platyrhynchus]
HNFKKITEGVIHLKKNLNQKFERAVNGNHRILYLNLGFLAGSEVKNLLANAGDMVLIPGSERSPEESKGNPFLKKARATHFSIVAWKIPGTEEHGGLQSM